MTSPTDAQIEAVARAMFEQSPYRNQALHWEDAACPRNRYRKQARIAIEAYEQAKKEP